jgi:hypothetical protein
MMKSPDFPHAKNKQGVSQERQHPDAIYDLGNTSMLRVRSPHNHFPVVSDVIFKFDLWTS